MPRLALLLSVIVLACIACVPAQTQVNREEAGNRVSEGVPAIPAELTERLDRYQNTRGADVAGWTRDGCLLIGTRFAETNQAHRVCTPLGMREQLTFYPEPVDGLTPAPAGAWRDGFVFAKDKGGDEFSQLYWFDSQTRSTTLLTDGKRSQNGGTVLSHDGGLMAYGSTSGNGTDRDIWIRDTKAGAARALVTAGGDWRAQDFSPDGKRLLVMKYVSVNESYPGVVDIDSRKLELFPVDGGKAGFGGFAFAPDGKSVYFVSDEPFGDKPSEFQTLRYRNPQGGELVQLSDVPWDVHEFELSEDGRHLAYVTNEDGVGRLNVLALPSRQRVTLPGLPIGLISGLAFSPDGYRIAVTLNTAVSPSDAYVINLRDATMERWTRSEVGGLDTSTFVAPTLVQFGTFDQADGKPRTIPAFYYKPSRLAPGGRHPVMIDIHGGPEGQSVPVFDPSTQFLVNELGVGVLMPNVRGSSGYGKSYLKLDNAERREDSVRDIGALLDWIAKQPELDATRVGVTGGSYGGYMVLASLMRYSDRIKAGVDAVGISDFTTFLTHTESYRRDLRRAEYGDERDPRMKAVFDQISPLKNAATIKSPLFVAQGRNDPRVPYTEAEQIVKAVRGNGQPVWFLMFNDEGHVFRKKANADHFDAAAILFWQQHLLR